MRRLLAPLFLFTIACCLPPVRAAQAAVVPSEQRNLFQYAESAWGVGTVTLSQPMAFREGRVLVFPATFSDLLWAPGQAKPHNMMLVLEVSSEDKDKPYLAVGDVLFAPFRLLPENSYWRDNLPNTRRHEVAGGRRYMFRGEEIAEVRKVLLPYLAAHDLKTLDRWSGQVAAVVAALASPVVTVREDAARYLAWYPTLSRDFRDDQVPPVMAYLGGAAPIEERSSVANAMVSARLAVLAPGLRALADRDDATGAMALRALAGLGFAVGSDRLPVLSRATSPEVRAYAAEALGERAATDPAAAGRAGQILADAKEQPAVRAAAATGLGRAGAASRPVLLAAVEKGDEASRAAALALAGDGDPEAGAQLLGVLKTGRGEAAMAAAAALVTLKNCPACVDGLRQQHEKHPDEEVRHLLGVLLEVPLVHKH